MTQERSTSPTTRRSLLAAAFGGIAAWAVGALSNPEDVAAQGEVIHVGDQFSTATSETRIANYANGANVLSLQSDAGAIALVAWSGSSVNVSTPGLGSAGVAAISNVDNGNAVYAQAPKAGGIGVKAVAIEGTGVLATSTKGRGIWATSTSHRGVQGNSDSSFGVYGRSESSHGVHGSAPSASGTGVYGESSAGVGIFGISTTGYAIKSSGRVRFDKISGVASIPAGATSVTVTPGVDVTADSFVLLTAKANIGARSLYFSTDATNNRFTIRMSSSRTSATLIAWLLLR